MLAIVNGDVPVLDNVTAFAALVEPIFTLPNANAPVTAATGAVPIPASVTVCILPIRPPVLSVMVSVSLNDPFAVGLNVTLMSHFAPGAKLAGQVVNAKLVPVVNEIPAIARLPLPVLVTVTVFAALVVLIS